MKIKKIILPVMAGMMALTATASGCGNMGGGELQLPDFPQTPSEKDSWEYITEDFTLDWYVDYSWFTYQNTSADEIGRKVKEETGVTINFTSPIQNDSTMLNLMISGDTLPDLISIRAYQQKPTQLALEGYVYPIDELAKRWAPSLTNRIEQDIYDYYSLNDHIYGLPNCAYSNEYITEDEKWEPNGAMLVREDWYNWYQEQPDKMDITTKTGLKHAMQKVKQHFTAPNQKVVGMLLDEFTNEGNQSVTWLSQYFAAPFEDEQGNYVDTRLTDEYYEALEYLGELYSADLLSTLSNTGETIGTVISKGEAFVSLVTPQNYASNFTAAYRSDANVKYIPLILRNDAGDDPILQDVTGRGWLLNMITKNCKRPDLAVKVLDFLYSEEGQLLTNFGIEGDLWNWTDDSKTKIEWTQKYLTQKETGGLDNYGLARLNVLYNPAYIVPLEPTNALKDYELYIKNLKRPLSAFSYRYTLSWPKVDTTRSDYNKIINSEANCLAIWSEYLPMFIKDGNLQSDYQTAISQMKLRGLDSVVSMTAEAYAKGKVQAGVEKGWIAYQDGYKSPTLRNADGSYSTTPVGANGDNYYLLTK